ncbi:Nucleolar protein 12 [Leucoagaricus sp. SymC.cos]|nr:Nucleolar protein 12 [Leucoagaricus sp. SymC.cos]
MSNGGDDVEEEDQDQDDNEAEDLVHESLKGKKAKSRSKSRTKKQKYVPPDETPAQRDQRTVFIGNLALEVAQSRPLQKQLQRHMLSLIPTAKVESIRFRSVPFNSPSSTPSTTTINSSTPSQHKTPSQRSHDRTRASTWRSSTNPNDDSTPTPTPDPKTYLTPNQKRKMLFLTHQFHSSGTTVHAYIVFAHPAPASTSSTPRPANLPPLPEIMDPYEAAKVAVERADGSEFEGRAIRVDFVGSGGASTKRKAKGEGVKAFKDADPKLTLFVGNLDLGAQEEDLQVFFEGLVKTERGEPPSTDTDENAEGRNKRPKAWVTRIRIIRDKDTLLGKGFGYVQFVDRECVDEILALEPTQLKFAKRKLRVQRCKTLPGVKLPSALKSSLSTTSASSKSASSSSNSKLKSTPSSSSSTTKLRVPQTQAITIPKGDPTLGQKLTTLSKQERKAFKAADPDLLKLMKWWFCPIYPSLSLRMVPITVYSSF